jgi:hypothetical protein
MFSMITNSSSSLSGERRARVEDVVDGEHVANNVNNGWIKLDKCYEKIGESPLI